jgi:hypothetical protein
MKRFALSVVLLALGASVAFAAPLTGKVITVEKEQLRVVLNAKPESWIKKGGKVRVLEGRAFVVEIAGDTLTLSTPKAEKAKVGDEIKILKPRAGVAGC